MNKYLLSLTAAAFVWTANAQQSPSLTDKDYAHAENFLGYNTEQLVDHGRVMPNWLPGDKFWYRILTSQGSEFILVDPAKKTRGQAFDHQKLAAAISTATGKTYEASKLPFRTFSFSDDLKSISFSADGKSWKCDLQSYQCTPDNAMVGQSKAHTRRRGGDDEVASPDGSQVAYIKDYNLWVRNIKTGKETQLTTDGVKDFGYATDNAGWKSSDGPIVRWSPDSKKIATFKQDQRNVEVPASWR